MPRIIKRVAIGASAARVWSVLADFGNVEKWAPTVVKSVASDDVKRGTGAKRTLTTSSGEVTEEMVIEWIEGQSFTFEIPDGLASIIRNLKETWAVADSPTGADVLVTMDYQMKDGPIQTILDWLVVRRKLREMLILNLAGLKHFVETGQQVTAETRQLPVSAVV